MKIESLIKRKGGSIIDMDAPKRQYHFKPEDGQPHDSPHVANVDDDGHAKALLRIREGYRRLDGEDDDYEVPDGFLRKDQVLTGSNVHSASYEIAGGEIIQLGELVLMAFKDSGLSYEQWQDLVDQERYDYIDATLRELKEGEPDLEALQRLQQQQEQSEQQTGQQVAQQPEAVPPAPQQPETTQPIEQAPAVTETVPTAPEQKQPEPQPRPQPEQTTQQTEQQTEQQPAADEATGTALADMKRDDLIPLYQKRFGRKPSTRLTNAEIVKALSEDEDD